MAIAGMGNNPPKKEDIDTIPNPVEKEKVLDSAPEVNPKVAKTPQRRAVVDTQYASPDRLVIRTEGDKWIPKAYYRAVLGKDDQQVMHDVNSSVSSQAYEKYTQLPIHVDSPLEANQDTTSKEFEAVGEGTIVCGLIPNEGDMFIADIGGRVGVLSITLTEKLSYTKYAAYRVTYEVTSLNTEEIYNDLESKVVKTYYYVESMVGMGGSPFVEEYDYQHHITLVDHDYELTDFYKKRFWSKRVLSLLMPSQKHYIYDGMLADHCIKIGLSDIRTPIESLGNGYIDNEDVNSLWRVFEDMDTYSIPLLHRHFGTIYTRSLPGLLEQRTAKFSMFDATMIPIDTEDTLNTYMDVNLRYVDEEMAILPDDALKSPTKELREDFQLPDAPYYYNVTMNPYIFSHAFYDEDISKMSILELMVYRMLSKESVPPKLVSMLAEMMYTAHPVNAYYYIPILLTLIFYSQVEYGENQRNW